MGPLLSLLFHLNYGKLFQQINKKNLGCSSFYNQYKLQWNLDLTKSLGTGQICSLNGGFVISNAVD